MKNLIKSSGILLLVVAVILLGYYMTHNLINNGLLAISGILLIAGIIVHIITNQTFE